MKQTIKILAAVLITTITASAGWPLTGTVDSIKQNMDGTIEVVINKDSVLQKVKTITADDTNKQAKLAMLLTAKTSGATVTIEVDSGNVGYIIIK